VPENEDQRRAEELDGVLDAREAVGVEEVAGHPNDEQIAATLIEGELGSGPRVRAAEDDRMAVLASRRAPTG
jgi:hypothetical protein